MANETQWTNKQLLIEAEVIVVGHYGVEAVYKVLKTLRDDLLAAAAERERALQQQVAMAKAANDMLRNALDAGQQTIDRLTAELAEVMIQAVAFAEAWSGEPDAEYRAYYRELTGREYREDNTDE